MKKKIVVAAVLILAAAAVVVFFFVPFNIGEKKGATEVRLARFHGSAGHRRSCLPCRRNLAA